MVDINLLGGEESNEKNYETENFSQTINLDNDLGSSTGFHSEFSDMPQKSNNSRLLILLAVLAVVVIAVIWVLLPGDENMEADLTPMTSLNSSETMDAQIGEDGTMSGLSSEGGIPTDTGIQPLKSVDPGVSFESLSPLHQQMLASVRIGSFAMTAITEAVTGSTVFTLVRYSGNSFLAQFITGSSSETSDLLANLQRQMNSADLKKESEESVTSLSRGGQRVIVSGALSVGTTPVDLNSNVQEMGLSDFENWIMGNASSNGLQNNNFSKGRPVPEDGYNVTRIQLNLKGSYSAAISFLDELNRTAPSVIIDKFLLINEDASAQTSNNVNLVLVLKHYSY